MTATDNCQTCRFWLPTPPTGYGLCRKRAPRVNHVDATFDGVWPETMPTDWCGEWEARP